jgi:putative ABC transport system permease protein
VITSANSLGIDRANMLSGGGGTAMKIRLLGGDTVRTQQDLLPTLKRLKLDDNLPYLITMDQYVSQQIAALDSGIRSVEFAGLVLFVGLLVLAVQSLSILFERYSRRITVRRLFGAGFMRTYREPLLIFTVVWSFQLVGALVANRLGLSPFSTPTSSSVAGDGIVVGIAACVAAFEVLFSAGVLTFIERRSVVRVLKQEF